MRFGGWRVVALKPGDVMKENVLFAKQVHGGNIVDVVCLKIGECEADGVVLSKTDGVVVGVVTADCAPVVVVTDTKAVVLHVSRKTLIRGLLDNVKKCIDVTEIKYIYIGPHICEKHFCFEREGEEIQEFIRLYPNVVERRGGKIYLSMRKALQVYFNEWEVSDDRITEDGRCTFEDDKLPSYKQWCEKREGKLKNIKIVVWGK